MSDLSVAWQKSAQWESEPLGAGVTHCLLPALGICTPLTALTDCTDSDDMFFLAWSELFASAGRCLWPLVLSPLSILGGNLEPDTLAPQSCLLILLSTVFNKEPLQFTRVTPS